MPTKVLPKSLTLPQNILLTLIGQSIPILVGLFTVPALIHNIGSERFGALSIAWILIGYFSLFDLGLGRAVTRKLSQQYSSQSLEIKSTYLVTAMFTFCLGMAGGLVLYVSAPWLATHYLNSSDHMQVEVLESLRWMSLALPFVISSVVFRGALEAFGQFKAINKIVAPMGSLTYGLPFLISLRTDNLVPLTLCLVGVRILMWLFFFVSSLQIVIPMKGAWRFQSTGLKGLVYFGFWITSANIIGPILSYLDRMLIGSVVSVEAVAHYMVPIEIVLRIWMIPTAIVAVIYPTFSSLQGNSEKAVKLMERVMKMTLLSLFPIGLLFSTFSFEIISLWIGHDFSEKSGHVLQILGLGIWLNCLGAIPLTYIQARGRPDLPAKLYFFEFPVYIGLLYLLVTKFGIEGAAIAWVIRVFADTALLYAIARGTSTKLIYWLRVTGFVFTLNALAIFISYQSLTLRLIFVPLAIIAFALWVWFYIFSREDRLEILERYANLLAPRRSGAERTKKITHVGIAMACYEPDPQMFLEQLTSISNQTFENWRCIITFDSPLSEIHGAPQFAPFLSDPRFLFIQNPERLGVKRNFERALALTCELDVEAVAFSDQDDIWEMDKLASLIEALEKTPLMSLVHSDMELYFHESPRHPLNGISSWRAEGRVVTNQTLSHYLIRNCVSGAGSMFDVEIGRRFGRFPDEIDFHDHWITLAASAEGGVYPIDRRLYKYRQHSKNIVGASVRKRPGLKLDIGKFQSQLRRASESWRITINIIRALEKSQIINNRFRTPSIIYGIHFLILGVLSAKDDGVLTFASLVKGIGSFTIYIHRTSPSKHLAQNVP